MNGLNWRTLWDLEKIERGHRDARLEERRMQRDAGIKPAGILAPLCQKLGGALVAAGQRLAGEPVRSPAKAAPAA